jgi:hypothetical protein
MQRLSNLRFYGELLWSPNPIPMARAVPTKFSIGANGFQLSNGVNYIDCDNRV